MSIDTVQFGTKQNVQLCNKEENLKRSNTYTCKAHGPEQITEHFYICIIYCGNKEFGL